ncbi:MAG TPA: hypothetical protein GX391_01830 [Firmicutes bacterium]|jgi:hypothetical protein|nr:hypothetical protein [Bacillota bacterium]HOQ24227.1 hypothetical protein [Bacillota bacterium]HPT67613.1 hypothetical protein [Bacillota bacterium]
MALTRGLPRGIYVLWLLAVFLFYLSGTGARGASLPRLLTEETLPLTGAELRAWAAEDRAYMLSAKNNLLEQAAELKILRQKLKNLLEHPDYQDELGFSVYTPESTGRIYLVAAAIEARLDPTDDYPWGELLGHQITWEAKQRHPELARVVRALRALDLPQKVFRDYRVFLLPFSLGDAGGYGGNGYALLAATPAGTTVIPNQLEVTLTHEVGHHLHSRYMDRSTPNGRRLWERYLQLRKIPWQGPGEVNTSAWGASSEEVFAEDFRIWAGDSAAAKTGYFGDLAYPEPDAGSGQLLRRFFQAIVEEPGRPADPMAPWLSSRKITTKPGVLAIWLVTGGGVGLAAIRWRKKQSGRYSGHFVSKSQVYG